MREHQPYIDQRLCVGWSDTLGYGVFAKAPIKKFEFVEVAPVILCDQKGDEIMKYAIIWGDKLALALGWTMLYNHSDNNSCDFSVNMHERLLGIMTVRDIEEGQQLTVNYGPEWFSSRGMEKMEINK